MCKRVTDSAAELRILEIISESSSNNIDGALAVIWSYEWSDVIDNALTVIVEVSKALLDTLKFDSEGNGAEVVLTESMLLFVLFIVQTSSLVLIYLHRTFDEVAMHRKWCHFGIIKDTENSHITRKAITSHLDKLVSRVIRSTFSERAIKGIVVVLEFTIGEIDHIECQVDEHFVAALESGWRSTLHGVRINVVCWHESDWSH